MSFLIDSSIMITSQILFFGFGWLFFMRQLFKDYEVRQYVVQVIFSVTFAFSCTMFELIIFEILGVLNSRFISQTGFVRGETCAHAPASSCWPSCEQNCGP
ncbi:Golgi pH regulator [Apodemus speciosus]|uniref:Golgi pH regulator n=1 Tax=Apodemus speciosus TaxID=105296 RepID=A0ABQ0EM81_APOSI